MERNCAKSSKMAKDCGAAGAKKGHKDDLVFKWCKYKNGLTICFKLKNKKPLKNSEELFKGFSVLR